MFGCVGRESGAVGAFLFVSPPQLQSNVVATMPHTGTRLRIGTNLPVGATLFNL